jgi:amino acid adenylation domain-containing protein
LQVAALEHSLNEIVHRHEALRTTFVSSEDGQPLQAITPTLHLPLPLVDLQALPETQREAEVLRLATAEVRQPFNLAQGPLLRAKMLRLGREEHVLLLTLHHIIADGWSRGVIFRELAALYAAYCNGQPSPLPDLPIQYADFAVWQRQWLQGEVLERQLAYWKRQLQDLSMLQLPADLPRPAVQSYRGARQSAVLPKTLSTALKALSRREGVTLFMTLLAAFQTLLFRYTGQEDVIVGTPIANRTRAEFERLIGCFVNTLALRTDCSGNPSFRTLLGRVREMALEAYTHQDLPFEKLVEALQPERDLSHHPLFQVMLVLQNTPLPLVQLPDLTLSLPDIDTGTAKFDLTLFIEDTDQGLKEILEYNTALFDAGTITRMCGHFQTLLTGIVADPDQHVSTLPLMTPTERHQILIEWNDTRAGDAKESCIHQLFEAQLEQTPEAVAVVWAEQKFTYSDLNTRANQLAHYLRKHGVGPEVLVGICVERSIEMIVGLLGILKAGGAYVPLDATYPRERLAFMLEDARVPVLLTQRRLVERLPAQGVEIVCLDADWEVISRESKENPTSSATADNLAYVIYTSGSTGKPKGVAIQHRSTVAFVDWAKAVFSPQDLTAVLAATSICFDLSVFEFFVPLSCGGRVILAENALQLPTLPAATDVTLINTVPSAIAELLRVGGVPASVRTVNLAGEPLHHGLVQQLYQQDTIQQVFNLYGPTEATTYSTFALVKKGANGPPPIGRPIANTQIYLLDPNLQPVPVGIPGELHIGGAGLARGYLNRPELTAQKFILHPFSTEPGARLYKTGDLARYLPNGDIEYLGRLDHQVKIRGFRIELGEIETVLGHHPAVREAVVLAREDAPDDKRLVAYAVPHQGSVPAITELRRFLQQKLPEYMVPSAFVLCGTLPLTPNGKVDRRALPMPDQTTPERKEAFVAPRTPVEEVLAGIWVTVLGLEQVGIHDNFFELGGHSLKATQVMSRLRHTFQVELPLRTLFEMPTIAGLAEAVERAKHNGPSQSLAIMRVSREAHRVKQSSKE